VSGIEESEARVAVHHSGGIVEADYVVLACPASVTARLDGNLAAEDREVLEGVRYAPSIALFFGYDRPITVQHFAVIPSGPGDHPIAAVWTASRWVPDHVPEGKELVCIHATAWRSRELLESAPAHAAAALRADAEEIFGRLADPDWVRMYPRTEATVIPVPGHYRRVQELLRRPRKRVRFAGDWITGSTIEGALRTGLAAAEGILGEPS
jgi:predicted NAD/FAD-dependent oxidoreductase